MEEEILEAVSRNDEAYEGDALEDISWEENLDIHRPNTATIADDHDDGVRKNKNVCLQNMQVCTCIGLMQKSQAK